jgi:hypothetical protein
MCSCTVAGGGEAAEIEGRMFRTCSFVALLLSCVTAFPVWAEEAGKGCYPITAADLVRKDAPAFEAYPAKPVKLKTTKLNIASNREARFFKSELRRGCAKGPNFAGHYTVAQWSCGTDCVEFAVVEATTGKVIFADDFALVSGSHVDAKEFENGAAGALPLLRYKPDSRLLIVVGALDEDPKREGAFYYVLEKDRLKPVFAVNCAKEDCGQEN